MWLHLSSDHEADTHHLSYGPSSSNPKISLINFIRPQGHDHPPCGLCISVYGAKIISSMHLMTNQSMPHLYLLTFIISLAAETIHPYISFIISLKLQGHGHPPCWLCISFYGAEIIYPKHQLTNCLYHKAVIIHINCVCGVVIIYPTSPLTKQL